MKCPICSTNRAVSPHHIRPREDRGSDGRKNKILLCKSCHNIVEDLFSRTGKMLSPQMIESIRLEYSFPDSPSVSLSVSRSSLYYTVHKTTRNRKRRIRFAEEKSKITSGGIALRCPYCGKWHYPEKSGRVICPVIKSRQPTSTQHKPDPTTAEYLNTISAIRGMIRNVQNS